MPLLWELPYDKRKDIPQLTMSLQVYDGDPAQRFAIVNDERHVEGDDLGGGLTLKEIAPDITMEELLGITEGEFTVDPDLKIMEA